VTSELGAWLFVMIAATYAMLVLVILDLVRAAAVALELRHPGRHQRPARCAGLAT